MADSQVNPPFNPAKLNACLTLLRKINWARRKGKRDLADKLLKDLRVIEEKRRCP